MIVKDAIINLLVIALSNWSTKDFHMLFNVNTTEIGVELRDGTQCDQYSAKRHLKCFLTGVLYISLNQIIQLKERTTKNADGKNVYWYDISNVLTCADNA